ncbi:MULTISPECIES: hypothetical protein [Pseudoalteromonas]|jgi:hypothetical protein|uniref:Lipoprotein n=1 Tax=Pseudoalteromonas arctica TaxID=394751 RepID=A0ABU9TG06_9GAMM|nr:MULTISPECIES: hypothetical protein [Pseudoalteromonas]MBB1377770.1 hypothetical protein [Pseudoalteromonas sp. SR43-2]MBD0410121.1 hypothetical protein [Pseudoalteromonas distincta]MBG9992137.1 hypothetical protein [Pseudoalteromonas sp. NZS37]MBH0013223.1 hypothetical protein [Pseudoalteromonas sp. NZS100_1]MBH0016815.1 hypothetical protein [Pseudoalteromonas sp. NGC95]
MKIFNVIKALTTGFLLAASCSALSHAGHGSNAPWEACEAKAINEDCSYTSHDKKATGTCQAMNKVLMCVRNKPLETLIDKATQPASDQKQSVKSLAKR